MDIFLLRLFSQGFEVPRVRVSSYLCKDGFSPSQPYITSLLEGGTRSTFTAIVQLTTTPCKSSDNARWNYSDCQEILSNDSDLIKASNGTAPDVILKLSDELPAPGSYLLNIVWDMRGLKIDTIRDFAVLFGAVKKLCSWHAGHLHAYVYQKDLDSTRRFITFMDPHASVSVLKNDTCVDFHFHEEILWRGSLDILTGDVCPHRIQGVMLAKEKCSRPDIKFEVEEETSSSGCSFSEDSWGHLWIEPRIQLLAYVDTSTVPLYYFSGKRFILAYRLNADFQQDALIVQRMHEAVNSNQLGAFLCCMKYSLSKHDFDPIPEFNSSKWKEAVAKDPRKIDAPKFVFPYEIRTLYILLGRSQLSSTQLVDDDLKQFSAHVLHRPEELDFRLPFEHDLTGAENCEEGPLVDLNGLPTLDPYAILHKEKRLDWQIAQFLRQCIGQNKSGFISSGELKRFVNTAVQKLDTEQESIILDLSSRRLDQSLTYGGEELCLQEWRKKVFANMDKIKNMEQSELRSLKSVNPLQPSNDASAFLDMHFKPQDVLRHFTSDGELIDGEPIVKASQKLFEFPDQVKLGNFNDAIHLSYHGIAYNIHEQAAEKFDRMCRRLVQRQVKFETCSVGSTEKVPSPATINVADSPPKSMTKSGSASTCRKRSQLKKVAEKLYKKRIRTRNISNSDITQSAMVLRSTPKKSQNGVSQNSAFLVKAERTSEVSTDEHKRLRRRTYVQDNKRRLQSLVTQSLIDNGVPKESKEFQSFSRRLYNVSMAFLRELKSSKDLDQIMMSTVSRNVDSVISFKTK